jgi:hypothetical protein
VLAGYGGDYGRYGEQTGYEYQPAGQQARDRLAAPCPLPRA